MFDVFVFVCVPLMDAAYGGDVEQIEQDGGIREHGL